MTDSEDFYFMRLALKEAKKGLGRTSPNPCVGAVIVKDGRLIAKGYHQKAGSPHAEINAIRQAVESVAGSTMYVTLEPCNHTGKTPPCTQAIIASGVSRVVVGMQDPNPLVNGTGINFLKAYGLDVTSGILRKECEAINLPFIKHTTTGLPWIMMKAGVSLDGRLNYQDGESGWLTGKSSVVEAHRLRNRIDAILVGSRTIKIDNPELTTRLLRGRIKDPIRIILDTRLSTQLAAKVYNLDSTAPTWVFHAEDASPTNVARFQAHGVRLFSVPHKNNGLDLFEVFKVLGGVGLCSVMVEGGAKLHSACLKERLFDYANLFYAPLFAGDNGMSLTYGLNIRNQSNAPKLVAVHYRRLGDDMLISGRVSYPD